MRALRQVCLSLDFVKQCGLETKFHGRNPNEASHYCGVCEVEVRHTSCGFPCKMFSFSVSVNALLDFFCSRCYTLEYFLEYLIFIPLSFPQVFDILFVKEQERRHVVHCIDCARRQAPRLEGFVVLEEYHLSDLCQVYDNFILHSVSITQRSRAILIRKWDSFRFTVLLIDVEIEKATI